ncbi:MAG: 50S ribosomal protein L4 [Thermoplasmata archaeon]|nr:50S ribosomal protein L4 [Thermoplasmata archaeon]
MAERKLKKVKKSKVGPKKVNVYATDGSVKKQIELPKIFHTEFRPDLISRASVSIIANTQQPFSPKPGAGMRHAVSTWGKGHGVSRVQRLKGASTAAQSPNNVGGRRAHPPRVNEDRTKSMNRKEMRLARTSALAATSEFSRVIKRGHKLPNDVTVPIILEDNAEKIETTKEAVGLLRTIGLDDELARAENGRRIRAGRGKMRGRKHRERKSVLIVVSGACPARKSFANIIGVDVAAVDNLNVEQLAPGGLSGRLTLISESALSRIGEWAS